MQDFREWLRATLEQRQWTTGDLERASGVNNSIIWRWLQEPPRRPTPANLKRIAKPLGVGYEELMRLCGYLPGEPVMAEEQDPRLAIVNARWSQLSDGLKDAIVRITGPKPTHALAG